MWKLLNSNSIVLIFDAINLAETDILMLSNQKWVFPYTSWAFKLIRKAFNHFNNLKLSLVPSHIKRNLLLNFFAAFPVFFKAIKIGEMNEDSFRIFEKSPLLKCKSAPSFKVFYFSIAWLLIMQNFPTDSSRDDLSFSLVNKLFFCWADSNFRSSADVFWLNFQWVRRSAEHGRRGFTTVRLLWV